MGELLGTPIEGTVAADTFKPILPPEEINITLVEKWKSYLTDCLKNNFALYASLSVVDSGGTVLWLPKGKGRSPRHLRVVEEFAKECLGDFIRKLKKPQNSLA